jgi:hypothetical protein
MILIEIITIFSPLLFAHSYFPFEQRREKKEDNNTQLKYAEQWNKNGNSAASIAHTQIMCRGKILLRAGQNEIKTPMVY